MIGQGRIPGSSSIFRRSTDNRPGEAQVASCLRRPAWTRSAMRRLRNSAGRGMRVIGIVAGLWRPRRRGGSWKIQRCNALHGSDPDDTGGGSGRKSLPPPCYSRRTMPDRLVVTQSGSRRFADAGLPALLTDLKAQPYDDRCQTLYKRTDLPIPPRPLMNGFDPTSSNTYLKLIFEQSGAVLARLNC